LVLAGALAACVYGGVAEFETYKTSFDNVQSTSTAILDQLAQQERWLFFAVNKNARSPVKFDPNLARYYTDSVDPPGTASFRAALATIKTYNDLLYGLETGQTAQALAAKVAALEASITSAASDTSGLFAAGAPGATASIQAAITSFNGLFGELQPFLQLALTARSQEEFRTFLVQSYPTVRKLLLELRNSTAKIFPVLTAAVVDPANRVGRSLTAAEQSKIDTYRKLLADWVVLIETTIKALDTANVAALAPPTLVDRVTGLTTIATELDTAAQSARKNLAKLATK
jgi:flagellin-like hook-associated protein FlgL